MAPNASNLETYSALMETLASLRDTIRRMAREVHGEKWQDAVFVGAVREHLELRRERESAIQWRLPAFTDLLDFAGFEDLGEIIASEAAFLAAFKGVVPGAELLRARLLELEAIQHRISYGRPVGDIELEFVVSFGERLRRVDLSRITSPAGEKPSKQETPRKAPRPAAASEPEPKPAAGKTPSGELEAAEEAPDEEPEQPAAAPQESAEAPTTRAKPEAASKPAADRSAPVSLSDVARALDEKKDAVILRGLYNEVTAVAELLWQKGEAVDTPIWQMVSEAQWYSDRFSKLGLKPVSDFYVLVTDADERRRDGASATAVKEMLQERRFGEILLALRELFRKHLLTS